MTGLSWQVTRGQAIRGAVLDAGGKPVRGHQRLRQREAGPEPAAGPADQHLGRRDRRPGRASSSPGCCLAGTRSASRPGAAALDAAQARDGDPAEGQGPRRCGSSCRRPASCGARWCDEAGKPVKGVSVAINDGIRHQRGLRRRRGQLPLRRTWRPATIASRRGAAGPARSAPGRQRRRRAGREGQGQERVRWRRSSWSSRAAPARSPGSCATPTVGRWPTHSSRRRASRPARRRRPAVRCVTVGGAASWGTPHLTDHDGRFTLTDLANGKHSLRAHRKGGGEALLEHVEAGGDVVLTIARPVAWPASSRSRAAPCPRSFGLGPRRDHRLSSAMTTSFAATVHGASPSCRPASTRSRSAPVRDRPRSRRAWLPDRTPPAFASSWRRG